MFTGFEVAQNFVISRLFSRESCVKTDKINTIQQSGVGQLRSYALRQVSVGSRDSEPNLQVLPSVWRFPNHPFSLSKLKDVTKLHCSFCSEHEVLLQLPCDN